MRAIKSRDLRAIRDNRNQWRIDPLDLDAWRLHTVRNSADVHTLHTPEVVIELREKLAAAIARADAAEADRDRWQAMAEKLADRPGWWARLWQRRLR